MLDFQKIILSVAVLAVIVGLVGEKRDSNLTVEVDEVIDGAKNAFDVWANKFAKFYRNREEKLYRFGKFQSNLKYIEQHNQRFKKGLETFELGVNQFADMDNHEFSALYLRTLPKTATKACTGSVKILDELPYDEDWAPRAVTIVKNQGLCTGAWAFTAVGALEGLSKLTQGNNHTYSPQQLIDCSSNEEYGNKGCTGGEVDNAFWYVIDNGITTEPKYPYTGTQQNCSYTPDMKVFQNSQCAKIKPNSTKALQSALIQQPVAVMVESNSLAFQFYRRGIFNGKCGTTLNHAMVLTGYGALDEENYWKCKNSWGLTWGQQGYIFMKRDLKEQGVPGTCGILMQSSVPLQ